MKRIEKFNMPEHTSNLYKVEAMSSISLSKEVADKINEIIDCLNAFSNLDLEWKQDIEGRVAKGVVFMKDNLINSINELLEILKASGFIDDKIEEYSKHLKERVDNLIGKLNDGTTTVGAELIDIRTGLNGVIYSCAGESIRAQIEPSLFNKPEFYGAIGDGEHNDSEAMQRCVDKTGHLYLSRGKSYVGDVTVKNPNSVITGGGTLKGGIVLYSDLDDEGYPKEGNVVVDGITIEGDIPVQLGRARGFTITNCQIKGNTQGILFNQTSEKSQLVNKGIISNNRITGETGVELRELNDNVFGGCADITISHNTIESSVRNVLLISVDGCKITNNTMFMNGFSEKVTTKKQNIYTQKTNWLTIENNTLFEAGEESIRIEGKSRNTLINSNIIGWCGQVKLSSGIYVGSYDTSGLDTYLNIIISNNIISVPTKHGIEFGGYMVSVITSNNMISELGKLTYYYGEEDFDSIEHYGIYTLNQDSYDSLLFSGNVVTNVSNKIGDGIINTFNLDASTDQNLLMPSKFMRLPHKVNSVSGGIWFDATDKKLKYSDGSNTYTLAID